MKFKYGDRVIIKAKGFYEGAAGCVVEYVVGGVTADYQDSYNVVLDAFDNKKWFEEEELEKQGDLTFFSCKPSDEPFFEEP